MTDKPKRLGGWTAAIVVGLIVLVGYPLSVGPAAVAVECGKLDERAMECAFAPLIWLCERSEAAEGVTRWYAELWFGWAMSLGWLPND